MIHGLAQRVRPGPTTWQTGLLALVSYLGPLRSAAGRMPSDTKLYLYLDPTRLLADAPWMWDTRQFGGWVPHQAVGYLWPMGPWFWVFEHLGVPDWVAHRLWIGTLIFAAATGMRWCARRVGLGPHAALAAALVYGLSPFILPYVARTSGQLPSWAALPWILGLVVGWTGGRSRGGVRTRAGRWRIPALIALVVVSASGLNATAIVMITPAPLLWLLDTGLRRTVSWRQIGGFVTRTAMFCLPATAWWIGGLVVQGRYGADVLAFTETVDAVSFTSNGSEVLRGLGYWLNYVGDRTGQLTASATWYQVSSWSVLTSFGIVVAACAGLVLVRWRARRFAAWTMLAGLVIGVGVHPIAHASPLFSRLASSPESGLALALRSSTRAIPNLLIGLALGAGALADGWAVMVRLRRRSARFSALTAPDMAICVAFLAVANLPGLWRGELVSASQSRSADIPPAWTEAGATLDGLPDGYRVLQIPGSEFGVHRWGTLVDPLLPAITDRGVITRDLVPSGSPAAMDLLYALDDRLQDGVLDPRSLAPVSRLLGADQVLVTGDLAFERFGSRRPAVVEAVVGSAPGIGAATGFGRAVPNEPPVAYVDPQSDDPHADDPIPPAVLHAVDAPQPIVRAKATEVVLVGSGAGVVDAAGAGLIDGSELLRYAGSLDDGELTGAVDRASLVVLTDSNRRQAHEWRGSRDAVGFTEDGSDDAVLRTDPADHRLDVFATERLEDQTRAVSGSGIRASATSYGEPSTYRPEDRAGNAVDGDLSTAWLVGDRAEVLGERLRIEPAGTGPVSAITLVQPQDVAATRWITRVRVRTAEGSADVTLDERSRRPEGQEIVFESPPVGPIDITITAGSTGRRLSYPGLGPVGFAEVGLAGAAGAPEVVHLPTRLGATPDRLAVVLTRWRADPADRWRDDPEQTLQREFTLPAGYTLTGSAAVRLDPRLSDEQLRALLGVPAMAVASAHAIGRPASGGWAAFDGDPATEWITPVDGSVGASVTVPLPAPATVDHVDLRLADDAGHGRPTVVTVSMSGIDRRVDVPAPTADGTTSLTFEALTGDRLTVRFEEVEQRFSTDSRTGEAVLLPIAVGEVVVAGLSPTALPEVVATDCRSDLLTIDGLPVPLRLSGDVAALLSGAPATAEWCNGTAVGFTAGPHRVGTAPGAATGWQVDQVVLQPSTPAAPPAAQPTARVLSRTRTARTVEVGACPSGCWLVLGEGWNEGWEAEGLDGTVLGPPQVVDGGFNGWLLTPSNEPRQFTARWTPQRMIWPGMLISIGAVLLALLVVVLSSRSAGAWRDAPAAGLLEPHHPDVLGSALIGRLGIAEVVGAVLAAGLVIGPGWGVAAGIITGAAWVNGRRGSIGLLGTGLVVGLAAWYIHRLRRLHPLPGYGWVRNIESAHGWAILAIVLVAVACSRPASAPTKPTRHRPSEVAQTPAGDEHHRLADDRPRHLGRAELTIDEGDRVFLDAQTTPDQAPDELAEERVPVGGRRRGVDGGQRRGAVDAEPRRAVTDPETEDPGGVAVPPPGEQASVERPVARAAPRHVARADHGVGAPLDAGDHRRDLGGIVREVGIHRHDRLVSVGEGDGEAVAVRGPEALLAGTMEHRDPAELAGHALGELAGSVRAVVVDDQDGGGGARIPQGPQHPHDVLRLFVGGEHDDATHGRRDYRPVGTAAGFPGRPRPSAQVEEHEAAVVGHHRVALEGPEGRRRRRASRGPAAVEDDPAHTELAAQLLDPGGIEARRGREAARSTQHVDLGSATGRREPLHGEPRGGPRVPAGCRGAHAADDHRVVVDDLPVHRVEVVERAGEGHDHDRRVVGCRGRGDRLQRRAQARWDLGAARRELRPPRQGDEHGDHDERAAPRSAPTPGGPVRGRAAPRPRRPGGSPPGTGPAGRRGPERRAAPGTPASRRRPVAGARPRPGPARARPARGRRRRSSRRRRRGPGCHGPGRAGDEAHQANGIPPSSAQPIPAWR